MFLAMTRRFMQAPSLSRLDTDLTFHRLPRQHKGLGRQSTNTLSTSKQPTPNEREPHSSPNQSMAQQR
eukprot:scaffold387143_cov18-Prasinocladus_malaysianus.AAC.1